MGSELQAITDSYSNIDAVSTSKTSSMDMDAFLTMFTTQLKYQDPTNPLKAHELAAQLAQFTTVERLTEMSDHLEQMESYMYSMNNTLMVQMLGKEITGVSDVLQLKDGQVSKSSYDLETQADVTIKVYDSEGNLVRTILPGVQEAGCYDVAWDGCDDSGKQLADGSYRFEVEAIDANGDYVQAMTTVTGKCCAIQMLNGMVFLALGSADGIKITPSAVLEVRDVDLTG
jgi:flagellar basal-body rod modification protein FlgD